MTETPVNYISHVYANDVLDVCRRIELRQREQDRERQKRDWEMKERQREESRLREEEALRRQQDEMQHRLRQQEEEMRRRQQENSLFMQEQGNEPGGPDYRRPMQQQQQPPPPMFDRPGMGGNGGGPHNLMDLPMVSEQFPFASFTLSTVQGLLSLFGGCFDRLEKDLGVLVVSLATNGGFFGTKELRPG